MNTDRYQKWRDLQEHCNVIEKMTENPDSDEPAQVLVETLVNLEAIQKDFTYVVRDPKDSDDEELHASCVYMLATVLINALALEARSRVKLVSESPGEAEVKPGDKS